jgi:hypothetical protein
MPRQSVDAPHPRRQPPRRCKRIHLDDQKRLLDLPEDMIRVILQFSLSQEEQGRWLLWQSRVGAVVVSFASFFQGERTYDSEALRILPPSLQVPFLTSFLNTRWKEYQVNALAFTGSPGGVSAGWIEW